MTAMKVANRRVFRASEERAEYVGMGTTLVAALAEGAHLTFSSVGDSRLYEWRDGKLRQLTKDDFWVLMLSRESGLNPASLRDHPMRHVLTNVIGARPELDVSVSELDLVDGQTLLLCTDGAHGALTDDGMASRQRRHLSVSSL